MLTRALNVLSSLVLPFLSRGFLFYFEIFPSSCVRELSLPSCVSLWSDCLSCPDFLHLFPITAGVYIYSLRFHSLGASLSCSVELSPVHAFVLVLSSQVFFVLNLWIFSLVGRLPREGEFT